MSSFHSGPSAFAAGPSRYSSRPISWQPLPTILSGFAIHPYHPLPSPPNSPSSPKAGESSTSPPARYQISWADAEHAAESGHKSNPYEISLDVGDEFFAFEEYRNTNDEEGTGDTWYRGYIVQAVSLSSLAPPSLAATSTSASTPAPYPKPEPSVLIGVFPSSCVHVRPEASVDDGTLAAAYEAAVRRAEERENGRTHWEMEAVKEEDEEEEDIQIHGYDLTPAQINSIDMIPTPSTTMGTTDVVDITKTPTGNKRQSVGTPGKAKRPSSLVLSPGGENMGDEDKEQPPLPRLTAGDSTIAGQQWPLVDEIACAIREWYSRLPTYLVNREYRLFSTVTQHIDALFLGRRQLLSQTLSGDELVRVRRECVSRLAKCNVAQGLDVIVRSLEDGSVMVTDKQKVYTNASWIGGVTCYVHQVQLAYIDLTPLDALLGKSSSLLSSAHLTSSVIMKNPALNRFSLAQSIQPSDGITNEQSHYNLFLDVRAFVASPCGPGETAELFFSLYNHVETRFISEEFCLILNHLGSPLREAEQRLGRLRTLYTDLKVEDVSSNIYLICRIVRNGALKMRSDAMAGTLETQYRGGSIRRTTNPSDIGTLRAITSIAESVTDDSFSVTSGFGEHRANTVETTVTSTGSVVDGRPSFRRPLGCAVIDLPHLSKLIQNSGDKSGLGTEVTMPIFVPKDEATFATLHEDIIKDNTKELYTFSRADAVAVSLKVFKGAAEQVVRENPSFLLDVPLSARLGFPDVVAPNEFRNDLYVKLWSAAFFPAPTSTGGSIRVRKSNTAPSNHGNVQVTIEVRNTDGTLVPDAIVSGGSGEPPMPHYHSLVFTHTDKPTFGELIKVSLPARAEDCHLFLTFRSRGKDKYLNPDPYELEKPFAFAYLPLISEGACVKNKSHELVLFRMERSLQPAPHIYFEAPALDVPASQLTGVFSKNMTALRDRMVLRTYLCSNLHTQDDTLRSLFRWQMQLSDVNNLTTTLQMFGFVNEEEIAKFVPRVLDSLFGILVSNLGDRQDEVDDLVFKSLVKVLAMTSDRRFPNFSFVLDKYVSTKFNYTASSFHLLRSMKNTMSKPETKDYRSFLKVWHLFFRFIIRSRELDRTRGIGLDATSAHIEADFQRLTKGILSEINTLMTSTDKGLIGTQTVAVQHYADIFPHLAHVFPPLEIAEMVIAFADTLTFSRGSIAIYKLLLLLQVVKNVFDTSEARALLVPAMVRWVRQHLGKYDPGYGAKNQPQALRDGRKVKWLECNRLGITVVAWMINKLQEWSSSPAIQEDESLRTQEEDNIEYCLTLLPSILESYVELNSPETADLLGRHRSSGATYKAIPDVFPMSHPFNLVADLPPPSLLDRHHRTGDDGMPTAGTFNCGLAECATVIFTLVLAAPRTNLCRWLNELVEIEGAVSTSTIFQTVFTICSSVIHFEPFPKTWLTLKLMCLGGIIRLVDAITEVISKEEFIPPMEHSTSFDVKLWTDMFELLCDLCDSDQLALEDQTQQRRRAQWIISGDLREEASALLLRSWNALGWTVGDAAQQNGGHLQLRYGGYQTRFTNLAGRILSLCLSSHDALCESAVDILFSMIYAEYVLHGKFETIQAEIFAKLEVLFLSKSTASNTNDPTSRAYFVAQLRAVFESSPQIDTSFHARVGTFLTEVELFIDVLLTLRDLPDTLEWKDERASAIFSLTKFTRRIGRSDLYVRFVHQLVDMNVNTRDWLGAGYVLRLHADIYDWKLDGDLVDAFKSGSIDLPPQSQFARKESLYYHAIDYFVEAEAYKDALELCQQLATHHQRLTYSVPKLSDLLVYQARLWEKLAHISHPKPEYFRVAYFGGVTSLNKDKDFVVRGKPWERYSDFCETIQHKHPTAMIHRSKIPPPETVRHGDELVIWVTSAVPEPDLSQPVFAEGISENIQNHWKFNGIQRFSSQRPYVRGESNSVLTWTEKTILTTAEMFPGVLNRSEVVEIRYEQMTPMTNAANEVTRATKHLRSLINVKEGMLVDVKLLGTAINGAVDSPVSGGVKLYRTTFLEPAYLEKHPGDKGQVDNLRKVILEYAKAISDALTVHKDLCRDVTFHEAFKSHFHRSFADEIAQLPRANELDLINRDGPLPAVPTVNGTGQHSGDMLAPKPDLARMSTLSFGSSRAYKLPPLRLGPSPTSPIAIVTSPIVEITPTPNQVENGTLRRSLSVSGTIKSSPRTSTQSRSGARPSTNITSPVGNGSGNGDGHGNGNRPPSFGSRALSIVGSIAGGRRSRDSVSAISEGTVGELRTASPAQVVKAATVVTNGHQSHMSLGLESIEGEGKGDSSTRSKKKLKRFSSFIRRQ